jgi:hypothetical protein
VVFGRFQSWKNEAGWCGLLRQDEPLFWFVTRYLDSEPILREGVYISSSRWRSMFSEWHKGWWMVNISFTNGPRSDRNQREVPPRGRRSRSGTVELRAKKFFPERYELYEKAKRRREA